MSRLTQGASSTSSTSNSIDKTRLMRIRMMPITLMAKLPNLDHFDNRLVL